MKNNSILIDVTRLVDRCLRGLLPTGVDRVGLAHMAYFRERAQALVIFGGRWIILERGRSQQMFDEILAPRPGSRLRLKFLVGQAYLQPPPRERPKFLLNSGHSGLDRPDYSHRIQRGGYVPLFFLHDLIPITHPEYCRPGEAEKHRRRLDTMLTNGGGGIIVNSAVTAAALNRYVAANGSQLPSDAVVVAPLALPNLPPPDLVAPFAEPYFLSLGTIEPRKNHLLLLHVWRRLAKELGERVPRLVIVGHRGWECEQVLDLLERCERLRGVVIELPRCSDAALSTVIHHARALLFPSFEEGYGLPLIEALAAGLPVLASPLPAFREIAGECPDYIDPLDGLEWRRRIIDYTAPDSPLRQAQCQRLASFRPPTWADHFEQVESLIARL